MRINNYNKRNVLQVYLLLIASSMQYTEHSDMGILAIFHFHRKEIVSEWMIINN